MQSQMWMWLTSMALLAVLATLGWLSAQGQPGHENQRRATR
jgi:hypothetical protein